MSDEGSPKTAAGMVVAETLKVVPEEKRQLAGQQLGDALVNATQAARDISTLLKWVAAVPRGAVGFAARLLGRWRRMPVEKRKLPSATMLLTAAVGYAETPDADLRAAFENLVASAMDTDRAHRVHPSFPRTIGEMTGIEARILRLLKRGGSFESADEISRALGVVVDEHAVEIAMSQLHRLGLVKAEQAPAIGLSTGAVAPGWISIGTSRETSLAPNLPIAFVAVPFEGSFSLTALGFDFIAVVDPDVE